MSNSDSSQYTLRFNEITGNLEFGSGNNWFSTGVTSSGVSGVSADGGSPIIGDVNLVAGAGVTLTPVGQDITIASTGAPGGADTQVQFNDGGVFGGNTSFTFDKVTGNVSIVDNSKLVLGHAGDAWVEFSTLDGAMKLNTTASGVAEVCADSSLVMFANSNSGAGSTLPLIYMQSTALGENIILGTTNGVLIGPNPFTSPDASAMLEVDSTTKGFLPPVMTTTQRNAIAAPAEGLIIYNITTHKLNVRTAAAWEAITSA